MGRLVMGAVGAVVGFYVGGPSGAYYGFAIGYGLGALTEDQPNVSGPRLSDLRFTSSQYGQSIPWIRGSPRISGSIVWASEKREISSTSSAGKGSGAESTNFTYQMDVLVLLCDHEAGAVSRIWSNGKLIWTRRSGASDASLAASDGSDLWSRLTFYSGAPGQLPDPTYEAAVGLGNAPAYRGRATLMIEGLQLGGSGQLPNLTFEVMSSSTFNVGTTIAGVFQPTIVPFNIGTAAAASSTVFRVAMGQWDSSYATTLVKVYDIDLLSGSSVQIGTYNVVNANDGASNNGNSDVAMLHVSSGTTGRIYSGSNGAQINFTYPESLGSAQVRAARLGSDLVLGSSLFGTRKLHRFSMVGGPAIVSSAVLSDYVDSILIVNDKVWAAAENNKIVYVLSLSTLALEQTINRPAVVNGQSDTTPRLFALGSEIGLVSFNAAGSQPYAIHVWRGGSWVELGFISSALSPLPIDGSDNGFSMGVVGGVLVMGSATNSGGPMRYQTWTTPLTFSAQSLTIESVVSGLCERAGMPAGSYDASALAVITKPVRSLAVNTGPTRGTLEQLSTAFFFQAYLRDKLYFKPRGLGVVASLPWTDLAAKDDHPAEQSLPLQLGNDLELPPQAAVTYINVNDDAQTGTEYSDRMTAGQAAMQTVQLGIGMTPTDAKGVADAVVADTAAALLSGTIAVPLRYSRLDPSDVIEVVDRDSRVYRLRAVRRREERGVLTLDVVGDDATAIESQQITDISQGQSAVVTKPGDTIFQPLDIPILRDADNAPGYYVAAKGSTTVWPGGKIFSSSDNVNYTVAAEIDETAVYGTCTTTLGNFTGIGFDEVNSLTVNVGAGELSSSTRDAMLADPSINALLVGNEIIRFRSATLVSAGVYTLSGLLRGQRGTEWAIAGHVASERAVLLRARGLRRVSQQASDSGQLRHLRAGTNGSVMLPTTTQFTNANRGLKPLAPVDIRGAEQSGQNVILSWRRRSRLSAAFLAPAGLPLGEAVESYVVRVYQTPSTLKRTLVATGSPSIAYTRAMQLTDGFVAGTGVRVDVAQVSAVVGEGYAGTATVRAAAQALPQVYEITLGGTFQSGTLIRASLGSVVTNYTTTVGDVTLSGAATSFAAAITAAGTYTASATGAVVTVTGPLGLPYSAVVSVVSGDNAISPAPFQAAAPASPGSSYLAYVFVSNSATGVTEPIPSGTTFNVQIQRPIYTTLYSFSYTTAGSENRSQVHSGLSQAAQATPGLLAAGYNYGQTVDSGGAPIGHVVGPSGVDNVFVGTSGTAPFGLGVSVQNPGSAAVPSALPQITKFTLAGTATTGWVYRVTLAGVDFDYTAVAGNTMTNVATNLAAVIDASPDYLASAAGSTTTVERATANVQFAYTARVISSSITAVGVITQQAT